MGVTRVGLIATTQASVMCANDPQHFYLDQGGRMTRNGLVIFVLVSAAAFAQQTVAQSQIHHAASGAQSSDAVKWAISIAGVTEPPELTGEPKPTAKPTAAQREFYEIVTAISDKDKPKTEAALPRLDKFIQQHAEYSDAFLMRATINVCVLGSRDYTSALRDINKAISTHSLPNGQSLDDELTDRYSFRGKLNMLMGKQQQALNDLVAAMNIDLSSSIFQISGTKPERVTKPCEWNLADLDTLVNAFPNDYLPVMLRGLYYEFFTTFNTDGKYYSEAAREFEQAATLNPHSALPQYLIGCLHAKASIWTMAAAKSEEAQRQIIANSIQAYTKAIQADPTFAPAYYSRAGAYFRLNRFDEAIADYNRFIELDPNNASAYSDLGAAYLQSKRYSLAIRSLNEAIRRKQPDGEYLENSYELRADAYAKLGDYTDAIADYSAAIRIYFGKETMLYSLKQVRSLYPEYDNVPDDVFVRKLHDLFWPTLDYLSFKHDMVTTNGTAVSTMLHDLYEKRGDAYLSAGELRRGALDFKRIFDAMPIWASSEDKWQPLGDGSLLDVKSVKSAFASLPARLSLKTVGLDQNYTVQSYMIDCNARSFNVSTAVYDTQDQLVGIHDGGRDWQPIARNTREERLYNGMCSH
jgi:tetratricopeptide (TPR) repeat protein